MPIHYRLATPLLLGLLATAACSDSDDEDTPSDPNAWRAQLDPDMVDVISNYEALGGEPIETLSAADAREQPTPADAVNRVLEERDLSTAPETMSDVEDIEVMGGAGTIPARVYTPNEGSAPYPLIVYYHGGGFVLATVDTYDASARALANATGAVVVSVEYRKAPENKFPAAHDDAYASYLWTIDNAETFDADAARVAVAGESAGGNLAANVVIRARDEGMPLPVHQLLIYPVTSGDTTSDSYRENAMAEPLNREMMEWFFDQYLPEPDAADDPRLDLVNANLENLPPTTIINAEVDPLLDDGEELAEELDEAGVMVEQRTFPGVTHEFFGMKAVLPEAQEALDFAADRLTQSFTTAF
jgi:acetyl esterase/lipase